MNWQEEREKAHCRVRDGESWYRLALEWGPWDPREPVSTCLRGSRVFPSAPQLRSSGGEAEIETPWWETIRNWPRESKRSKNTAGRQRGSGRSPGRQLRHSYCSALPVALRASWWGHWCPRVFTLVGLPARKVLPSLDSFPIQLPFWKFSAPRTLLESLL